MKKRTVLPVIECSGTEYEIGRAYGEQAKENIRKAVDLMYESMYRMPYQAPEDRLIVAARKYLGNVRSFDADAEDRVKGIADGAGISFDEAFALQCYSELFVHYPGLAGLCTSFAVTGEAAKGGRTIIGQNVDWHPDSTIDLLRIRQQNGSRMLSLFVNGYGAFYLTSSGLGNCANLTLCPLGPVKYHVPFAFYLYSAMQKKTIGQAGAVLAATARGVGYIHVADGNGEMRGVESVYDDYADLAPSKGVLVHANHYETEQYKKTDGAYQFIPDSFSRAERMRQLIAQHHGSLTVEKMMEILSDHHGCPKSICSHIDPNAPVFASLSVASFIMVPAEGRMWIALGSPCENQFVEYTL